MQVGSVLTYFGEQNLELEEPFRIIDQFIELFNTAIADVSKAKKRREDKEARRGARKSSKKAGTDVQNASSALRKSKEGSPKGSPAK